MKPALAINGGTPVRSHPTPSWPRFDDAAARAVAAVVESGNVNYWAGEEGRRLEAEYAESLGRTHALAVANGTLALELALVAFGIGPGDEVIVPSRTFIATAGAVVAAGATPVVVDIDADSGAMSPAAARAALSSRTRAIIPVHVGGWPADMPALRALADDAGLVVIEDCAQAHGARVHDVPAGSLGSEAAAFSFCQDKILAAGEGGILLLDDDDAYERAWSHRDHGKSRELALAPGDGAAYRWLVERFGTNWRLSEMVSALIRHELVRLPEYHAARMRNAHVLADHLAAVPGIEVPMPPAGVEHAFYRLYGRIDIESLSPGWTRDRVIQAIIAEGVPCQYGTCALIGRERAFAALGGQPAPVPVAERVHDTSIAFFVHPTLTEDDLNDCGNAVAKVLEVALG